MRQAISNGKIVINNNTSDQPTSLERPRRMAPERRTDPVRRQITASPTLLSSLSSIESPLTLFTRLYNSTKEYGNLIRPDPTDVRKVKIRKPAKNVRS
jgi:hypothetical protein